MVHLSDTADFMATYSTFQPTGFDIKGLNLSEQQDWFVLPVTRNRDSEALERSNWESSVSWLDTLDDTLDEPAYETHSFNHWGCGWFEIILINPNRDDACKVACEIVSSLEDYPVLDDELFSTMEWEEFEDWATDHVRWTVEREGAIDGAEWSILSDSFCLHSLAEKLNWSPQDRTPDDDDIIDAVVSLGMTGVDK